MQRLSSQGTTSSQGMFLLFYRQGAEPLEISPYRKEPATDVTFASEAHQIDGTRLEECGGHNVTYYNSWER